MTTKSPLSEKEESILKQIEFYFGDSNLSKDRFLKQKIDENEEGCRQQKVFSFTTIFNLLYVIQGVEFSIIANFNRLKAMTTDLNVLLNCVRHSSLIELSKDEKNIRRKVAFVEDANVDAKTIYVVRSTNNRCFNINFVFQQSFFLLFVSTFASNEKNFFQKKQIKENVPPNSTHDTLSQLFNSVGKVSYVSLPRWEDRKLKGFAFIEFAKVEDAKNAEKTLNQYDANKNPTGIRIIQKYIIYNSKKINTQRKIDAKKKNTTQQKLYKIETNERYKFLTGRVKLMSKILTFLFDLNDIQKVLFCPRFLKFSENSKNKKKNMRYQTKVVLGLSKISKKLYKNQKKKKGQNGSN